MTETGVGVNVLPLVSIVVNNYNYGRFVGAAIDSALAQTYPDVEVIVVDDGSTDDSLAIINGYRDQIKAIFKSNGGQASAFNAGFAHVHGDVVIFLDADDCLDPATAGRVAIQFRKMPDTAVVMYRLEVMDDDGKRTGVLKPDDHLPRRSGDLRDHILNFPFDMVRMATSGNAFSARALREIMPVPEHDYPRVGADWYLSYTIPLFGNVTFLDDVGGYYRVHGSNNFEMAAADVNLSQVRQIVAYARQTAQHIQRFSRQLGLVENDHKREVLSVSFVTNRLLSLKLDPAHHPIEGDSIGRLLIAGLRASFRRFDVAWPMRLFFALWFLVLTISPAPVARWLAIKLNFPSTRGMLNTVLAKMHRGRPRRRSVGGAS